MTTVPAEIGQAIPATLTCTPMNGPNEIIDIATCSVCVPSVAADGIFAVTKDTVYELNRPRVAWG
jgi:hypothetical protein